MFTSIRSLAVYVSNMDRAKRFYTEILDLQISADLGPTLCFLESKSGGINIYLEGGNKQTSADDKTCRLSFFLQTVQSASATYALLKAAGVELLQAAPEPVDNDTDCFQFKDPDGNVIEARGKP